MFSPSARLRINSVKHLGFSRSSEDEILRAPELILTVSQELRITLRHGWPLKHCKRLAIENIG
jgi:hypothetical protein